MPMNNTERASRAGRVMQAGRSTDEKSRAGAHAYLTGAVNTVIKRWAELTDDQRAAVRAVACTA